MLKRCLSPLTLVNQLALIVLLSTAIGVTGMAISGWLVQGVQGNAHAINEAGSLRMQSYRLLASVPLTQDDRPLIDEMERTVFSPELENAAIRLTQPICTPFVQPEYALCTRSEAHPSAFASARLLPATSSASVAAMNPSSAPSSTPCVSEVSWPVRRSFTI